MIRHLFDFKALFHKKIVLRFQNKQTKKTKKGNNMDENQKKSLELSN
jgi:hypothetical protein